MTPEDERAYDHAIRTAPSLAACLELIGAQNRGLPFLEGLRYARRSAFWSTVQGCAIAFVLMAGIFGPLVVQAIERRLTREPVDAQHVESGR